MSRGYTPFYKSRRAELLRRRKLALDYGRGNYRSKVKTLEAKLIALERSALPSGHDDLFERIKEIRSREDGFDYSTMTEDAMDKLARKGGSKFNGWYYYHSLLEGKTPKSGLSAAMEAGGLTAATAYLKSMR